MHIHLSSYTSNIVIYIFVIYQIYKIIICCSDNNSTIGGNDFI